MPYNISEFNELLKNRRSVGVAQYTGEKIADSIVRQILENANLAPTHRLTEPWRFKVFAGKGLEKLFAKMAEIYQAHTAPEKFSQEKYDKFFEQHQKVSHVIAICMHRDTQNRVPEIEEICAVACAVQNIYLSVTAYDLAGYWSTGGGTFTQEMKSFLGLAAQDHCLGFFYLGCKAKDYPATRRSPIEDKTEWVHE